jgi:hypothetical protein
MQTRLQRPTGGLARRRQPASRPNQTEPKLPALWHALRLVDKSTSKLGTKNATHMIIKLLHGDCSRLNGIFQLLAVEVVHRFFIVQTRSRCLRRAVGATPIGEYEAFELPVLLENIRQQILVLTGGLTVHRVVSAHHGTRMSGCDADLKGKQVALPTWHACR